MDPIEFFLVATGALYLGAILSFYVGLGRVNAVEGEGEQPKVSVIVAARNEIASIDACLEALKSQQYAGAWEVVVIDDRSSDGTGARVADWGRDWEQLKWVRASAEMPFKCPKKSALSQGIAVSSGELLLFTDADCRPPRFWITSMVQSLAADVGLVAGYAYAESRPLRRQKLLALDNLAIGALGAGSMGLGRPLSCTGRNLAYRRQVYDEVGGFADIGHLVAGDDVYFMRLVAARTQWKMVHNRDLNSNVVCAPPPKSWNAIIQQKLRHAGKAGHYSGPAWILGAGIYLFHLFLLVGLLQMLLEGQWNYFVLGVWGLRWLVDFALLWRFAPTIDERKLLFNLPFLEVCYIPYILIFSIMGRLDFFRWK